jgi:hypothetical protein
LQAAATTEDNAPAMRPPLVWCVPHGAAVNHSPEEFGTCESAITGGIGSGESGRAH